MLEQGKITIHTENIFPIIKKSLYTDHEIFLRELISNSVDAIQKVKMVSLSGENAGEIGNPEINISINKDAKTLSVSDNGIGMTADEVKKYINQVAFSSAEEFIEKYKSQGDGQIIGHFGLGFYSAFMVAKKVEIDTLSYKEGASAVHWSCDGSPEFELTESSRTERGTTVTLTLLEEEEEYLEPARIKQLIKTYCDYMSVPIKLDGETINQQKALWKESPSNLKKEDYLEFYRYLYPFQEEPLLWVHLNTDYPFILNGILFFPKLKPDMDLSKSQIKLFCNQVYVSDRTEDIIPKFLLPLRGAIDSTDIPLNVSRSSLTNNRTVRRISDYIAKKVGDRLKELYQEDLAKYVRAWEDIGTFVKFGAMNDEKFQKQVEDLIIFRSTKEVESTPKVEVQTNEGDAWQDTSEDTAAALPYTTLKDYLERNKEKHENRVFYCNDELTQASYVELHKNQGLEVIYTDSYIDNHFISFLEREHPDVKFSRVDADLDQTLLDDNKAGEIVDPATNKTRSEQIKELFENALNKPRVNVRTEALKSDNPQETPAAMILLPEFARRMQEMAAMMQQQSAQFPEDHILLVNTAHPLIQNLVSLNQGSIIQESGESPTRELVKAICHHVYDLALMSQKGLDAEKMKAFTERSSQLLTKLTEKL